jgi:hypothetical protein
MLAALLRIAPRSWTGEWIKGWTVHTWEPYSAMKRN